MKGKFIVDLVDLVDLCTFCNTDKLNEAHCSSPTYDTQKSFDVTAIG